MAANFSSNGGGSGSSGIMVGATAVAAGTSGPVPIPAAGSQNSVLTGAGTWVAPEFGFVNLANQTLTAGSTAYVDVVNSSMALTAGTWQIAYTVSTDCSSSLASPSVAHAVITNSANAIVAGSQTSRPGTNTSAFTLSCVVNVVVATPTTYKMRISNGDTQGFLSLYGNTLRSSTLTWTKLS
jgi:hypothetical protein